MKSRTKVSKIEETTLSADRFQSTLVIDTDDGDEPMQQLPQIQFPSPNAQVNKGRGLLVPAPRQQVSKCYSFIGN